YGSKSSPACCRSYRAAHLFHRPDGGEQANVSSINHITHERAQPRCAHDGQRKRVAHMRTATTTAAAVAKAAADQNRLENHPLDCAMRQTNRQGFESELL